MSGKLDGRDHAAAEGAANAGGRDRSAAEGSQDKGSLMVGDAR